jgi:hypothetical protein
VTPSLDSDIEATAITRIDYARGETVAAYVVQRPGAGPLEAADGSFARRHAQRASSRRFQYCLPSARYALFGSNTASDYSAATRSHANWQTMLGHLALNFTPSGQCARTVTTLKFAYFIAEFSFLARLLHDKKVFPHFRNTRCA